MAIEIVFSGYLDSDKKLPFAIIDTGETFSNFEAAKSKMLSFGEGALVTESSIAVSDHSIYQNMPNIWKDFEGRPSVSQIAFNADSGVAFASNSFDGTQKILQSNGFFGVNSYMGIKAPTQPALYIHLNLSANDVGLSGKRNDYQNGSAFYHNFSNNTGYACYFFDNEGIGHFIHDGTGDAFLGYLANSSTSFILIGKLQKLRMYRIQAMVSTAKGTVTDAVGNPAEGRKIAAFDRSKLTLLGSAVSKADGSYNMPLLAKKGQSMFVVCLDDDAPPDFEAQIYDRVVVT